MYHSNFHSSRSLHLLVGGQLISSISIEIFIALILPIQWTIANPVGADRPAKRQKKTSCVSTGWPVHNTVHSPDGASYFLSRQPDILASFLFGTCTVQTCFQQSPDILRKSVHYDGFYTLFANNLL